MTTFILAVIFFCWIFTPVIEIFLSKLGFDERSKTINKDRP